RLAPVAPRAGKYRPGCRRPMIHREVDFLTIPLPETHEMGEARVRVVLLCRRGSARLDDLIELQLARALALAYLVLERRPHPRRAVGAAGEPALPRDSSAFARDLLVVEEAVANREQYLAQRRVDFLRAVWLQHRAALEARENLPRRVRLQRIGDLHRQERNPVRRNGR